MTTHAQAKARARELAARHLARGDATGWFDALYSASDGDATRLPWAELAPKRFVAEWAKKVSLTGDGRRALVPGCGLGDDAAFLALRGFRVTAFDVSPTAVAWCRRRFADRPIVFLVADLLALPAEWRGSFDLVLDVYTVQSLPPALHATAIAALAALVAPGGRLLAVSHGRHAGEPSPAPPWPPTREELELFTRYGLVEAGFEEWVDETEEPPVRRFRAEYRRPASDP